MMIAKEGYPFIFISLFLTAVAAFISPFLAIPFIPLSFFVIYFFRDPDRITPIDPEALVSPADGTVVEVQQEVSPSFLEGKWQKIGIFMSPLNVHVNRAPIDGTVQQVRYFPGKFLLAKLEKSSEDNERNLIVMESNETKDRIAFVQIAGFVARRIVCRVKSGQQLKKGEKVGIIRFGSRVDVYLPSNFKVSIAEKMIVRAGETVLAKRV